MDFANLASQLNAGAILPEGIVIVTLLLVAILDLIVGRSSPLTGDGNADRTWLPYVAIAGLLATCVALYSQWDSTTPEAFLGAFNGDAISVVFRGIIALSTAVTILMSIRYVNQAGTALAEFIIILLAATLGAMFLCAANELVMIFVSLETLSISSYLLTGYMKRDPRSNEAALKYLLIGASASAVFLYGTSLLYGLSGGETNLEAIAVGLANNNTGESITLLIALVFAIAGISFKISAVPFHQWTPDVYEGSPTPVVAFLSVGSKAAGFALAHSSFNHCIPFSQRTMAFCVHRVGNSQYDFGECGGDRANQSQTNASLLFHWPSGICNDWPRRQHRCRLCQHGLLYVGVPVYEPRCLYLLDSLLPANRYRQN